MATPKIHELIAAEGDKVTIANTLIDEAVTTFAKKTEHFQGQTRTVTMYDVTREAENTTDHKELVETVPSKLDHVWQGLRDAIDITVTKENSNTSDTARADVIVDGKTVLTNVPLTALLALEKRLSHLKGLYQAIPTLDPNYAWVPDETAELPGTMKTKFAQEGQKTEKVMKVLTLAPATDKFPAQVEKYTMDENVAKVTTERQSGLVSPRQKALWMERISALATAVKEARQRANMADVVPLNVADSLHDFIHEDA